MYVSKNNPLPLEQFEILVNNHNLNCVSIYLSMNKVGIERNEHLAQATLQGCIREVKKTLIKYKMKESLIDNYLQPISTLVENTEFWRNPSDGLAIFLDEDGMKYYSIPIPFETMTYVSNEFYLKPLIPLYHEDGNYYVLQLSEAQIKLYKASRYSFIDLGIEDDPKIVEFGSDQPDIGYGSQFGHSKEKEKVQEEIHVFFKAIDKVVNKKIKGQKAPLILACETELFNSYKALNTYHNLYNKHVSGDQEFKDEAKLHEKSWELIKPFFRKTKNDKINKINELSKTAKVTNEISEIIPAAINGEIDTLFMNKDDDFFGTYNQKDQQLELDNAKNSDNISLANLVSIQTFLKSGKVYLVAEEEMPIKGEQLIALLRY